MLSWLSISQVKQICRSTLPFLCILMNSEALNSSVSSKPGWITICCPSPSAPAKISTVHSRGKRMLRMLLSLKTFTVWGWMRIASKKSFSFPSTTVAFIVGRLWKAKPSMFLGSKVAVFVLRSQSTRVRSMESNIVVYLVSYFCSSSKSELIIIIAQLYKKCKSTSLKLD